MATEMLTIKSILKTTRQMTSFGERGTGGALDHLPERVQGHPDKNKIKAGAKNISQSGKAKPARRWDDERKAYVHN